MTTLEAINIALQAIGEQPIETLADIADVYEAQQAENVLDEVRRDVLSSGLFGNTESGWPLTADATGHINVPSYVLRLDSADNNLIQKEGKLYNKAEHTYIFAAGGVQKVDVIWDYFYEDIDYSVAYYIAMRASRILYQRIVGVSDVTTLLVKDEDSARRRMIEANADVGDYNIFDSAVNSRTISRRSNPRGIRG
jgi:hypothetical protein